MYYKIDLSNYEPKEVPEYHTYNNFEFSSNELKWLEKELNNFQDSFGRPMSEWTDFNEITEWDIPELKHRLENNYTFYLVKRNTFYRPISGWAFIDWNRKYPYLCNRYVVPEFRRKGLGSGFVWLRCNEIVKKGHKTAAIHMADWNIPSKSVMKENIFTEIGEI
jgi:GNAT superfamily N-acetyltransferase